MKHIVNTFLPAIILLAFMLAGCDREKSKRSDTSSAESVDVAVPQVDSVVLHKQYPAYASAEAESDIVARVNGYIRQILQGWRLAPGWRSFVRCRVYNLCRPGKQSRSCIKNSRSIL